MEVGFAGRLEALHVVVVELLENLGPVGLGDRLARLVLRCALNALVGGRFGPVALADVLSARLAPLDGRFSAGMRNDEADEKFTVRRNGSLAFRSQ